jgi:hypothetical protein
MSGQDLYGIVATFERQDQMLKALRRLKLAGFSRMEVYTPFAVEEVDEILGRRAFWLPILIFAAGVAGAIGGLFLQYYGMAIGYPLNIGGRPLNSWPAFGTTTFELTVLSAILVGVGGLFAFCRMPRFYDPIFVAPGIERASQDRFVICIRASDERFDRDRLYWVLNRYEHVAITDVPSDMPA